MEYVKEIYYTGWQYCRILYMIRPVLNWIMHLTGSLCGPTNNNLLQIKLNQIFTVNLSNCPQAIGIIIKVTS